MSFSALETKLMFTSQLRSARKSWWRPIQLQRWPAGSLDQLRLVAS